MKTVSRREFEAERRRMIEQLQKRTCVTDIYDHVWFVNISMRDDPVNILINFSAMGAMKPIEATRFADCIKVAAELAMNFKYNGYIVKDTIPGYIIEISDND